MSGENGSGPQAGGDDMGGTDQAGGRRSAWMTHVKKTMRANKGKSLSQVLKMAKKTYKKTRRGGNLTEMKGGGVASNAATLGGRRRRGSRKGSKKGSRKH